MTFWVQDFLLPRSPELNNSQRFIQVGFKYSLKFVSHALSFLLPNSMPRHAAMRFSSASASASCFARAAEACLAKPSWTNMVPKIEGKTMAFLPCCCWSIFFCAKSKFKNKSPVSNSNRFPISVGLGMCTGPPIHNVLFLTCQGLPKKHPSFYSMPQFFHVAQTGWWSLRQNDPHPTPDPSWVLVDNLNFEALENCFKMNLKSVGRSKRRKYGQKKGGKIWINNAKWNQWWWG